jgi:2-iminobutanoate/2-iminopropanoate deaminase
MKKQRRTYQLTEAGRQYIYTENAPKGRGPFPQAVKVGPFLFVSGMGPLDKDTNAPIQGTFEQQVRLTLENIKNIVNAAGMKMEDAVRITIYLTDLSKIPEFNEIYKEYFPGDRPARALVQAGLRNIDVELESTFYSTESK